MTGGDQEKGPITDGFRAPELRESDHRGSGVGAQAVVVPEPGNGWIRYRYNERRWPSAGHCWLDLATAELRGDFGSAPRRIRRSARAVVGSPAVRPHDDVVYVPPVMPALRPWRLRLVHRLRRFGSPVCLQLTLGDGLALREAADLSVWIDLTDAMLGGAAPSEPMLGRLERALDIHLPLASGGAQGTRAVIPLLPVVIEPYLREIGELLDARGFAGGLLVAPRLRPAQRRYLASDLDSEVAGADDERGCGEGALYDALFHGPELDLDLASARLEESGLDSLSPRPTPSGSVLLRKRREAAGLLMSVAELRRRAGLPVSATQSLVRAALWLDRHDIDVEGWLRDDHLRLVQEVDDAAVRLLRGWLEDGVEALLTAERQGSQVP